MTFEPFLDVIYPKRARTFGTVPGGRGATTPSLKLGHYCFRTVENMIKIVFLMTGDLEDLPLSPFKTIKFNCPAMHR